MLVPVPTTPGELLDRLCILQLKAEKRPGDPAVNALLDAVRPCAVVLDLRGAERHVDELRAVNERLWDAETRLRELVAESAEHALVSDTAVRIATLNDLRGALKRSLDAVIGGEGSPSEPKFYQ